MSLIPEIIVQHVLVKGIRDVRENAWKADQIFRNVPQDFSQQFYTLLKETSIDITINYPREDSQFPCVAILLRGEEESNIFLDNSLGGGYDEDSGLFGSAEFFFTPNESTSTHDCDQDDSLIGEPRRLFDSTLNEYKERRGSAFNSTYTLQIMTDNQDFTVFLYHLLRFILLANIKTFELNGMHQMKFSGSDFLPQAAQEPNFIFMRGITMSFLYFADHFTFLKDEELVAKSFVLDINSRNPNSSHFAKMQSPHITSISVSTLAVGATQTGVIISGINFEIGASVSLFDPEIANSVDNITISNVELATQDIENVFTSSFAGQGNCTNLEYTANTGDTVPEGLSEGMLLRVTRPTTHDSYNEQRRIVSFTSGSNGVIKVATAFSSSLSGTFVEITKRSGTITFDMAVDSAATIGAKDVKVTNPDLMSDTLVNGFNIT